MSIASFKEKQKTNVAGSHSATCFVAAVDATSNTHALSEKTYSDYEDAYHAQEENGVNSRCTRAAIRNVLAEAGVGSLRSLSTKRARTAGETEKILEDARQGNRRVIVYTQDEHSVGLRPVSRGWRMVGNGLPVAPDEVLSSREVFDYLAQLPRKYAKGRKAPANIFTLPSERKRKE